MNRRNVNINLIIPDSLGISEFVEAINSALKTSDHEMEIFKGYDQEDKRLTEDIELKNSELNLIKGDNRFVPWSLEFREKYEQK